LVLSPKPRNRRDDFDAQIIKSKLLVLRPKPGNPLPPWFWRSTKKPTASFEVKPGETVATSFEAKLEKTITTGFEVKPEKTVTAGFEVKPLETIAACFEAKPLETVATSFEAKPAKTARVVLRPNRQKPSEWFQVSTKKHVLHVSMCMVQTTHGATQPLDRPATEYPTCATIPGPLHQVSYSCHDPHRCTPCRTCHLHTTRQANMILQMKQR
jgi:hypothetical protein